MLLSEAPHVLGTPGWLYELKFDGYRVIARFGDGACMLWTRNGADCTRWFPEVVAGLEQVLGGPHVVDGEVCVLDELGRSDFNRLQDRARRRKWVEGLPVTYCVFDLLVLDGLPLLDKQLLDRKVLLASLMRSTPQAVLVVGHFEDGARQLFDEAVHQLRLEGLVAKRAVSVYRPGTRSRDWVKVKRKGAIPPERFKR